MDRISELENQSIYIIREAYKQFRNLAMLWSMGKDSTVLIWLVKKAFFGHCPIPLIHIDTTYKIPAMIEYRDKMAAHWKLNLVVRQNREALDNGMNHENGRLLCCDALKTKALKQLMTDKNYTALMLGIRRDEEGTRAKERYFSIRDKNFEWNFKDQPPEFWNQFNTHVKDGLHVRIHPLLDWTEIDVWHYIKRENIPIIHLYFAKDGKRYRSLGCFPCTSRIESNAATVTEIITELENTKIRERSTRAQDQEGAYCMQKLRVRGYM